MKTQVKFDGLFSAMLAENGNDVQAVIDACQSEANKSPGKEGGSKRSDFRGGQSYKNDGTLIVKPITWKEQQTTEHEISHLGENKGKIPAPAELVKFHDALVRLWKQTGKPSGGVNPGILPGHLKLWLDMTCRAKAEAKGEAQAEAKGEPVRKEFGQVVEIEAGRRNGNVENVETPAPAK